jgi:hypothetical protein
MQSQGKHSFLRAMETRKDDVYSKVLKELTSLSDIKLDSTVVKYHKPCYRAYTSKQNFKPFLQSEVLDDSDRGSSSLTSSIIKTVPSEPSVFRRSDWSSCIFCKFKTHKNDRKLHKVETAERAQSVLDAAQRTSDLDLQHPVLHKQFQENAQYHSICITKYLLKNTKVEKVSDTESSKHELAFNNLISVIHEDLMFNKKAFLMSFLIEKFCSFFATRFAELFHIPSPVKT